MSKVQKIQFDGKINNLSSLRISLLSEIEQAKRLQDYIKKLTTIRPQVVAWAESKRTTLPEIERPIFDQIYVKNINDEIKLRKIQKKLSLDNFRAVRGDLFEMLKENVKTPKYSTRDIIKILKTSLAIGEYYPSSLKLDGDYLYFTLSNVKFRNIDVPQIRIRYNITSKHFRYSGVSKDPNDTSAPFEFDSTTQIKTIDDWLEHLQHMINTRTLEPGRTLLRLFEPGAYPASARSQMDLDINNLKIIFKRPDESGDDTRYVLSIGAFVRPKWGVVDRKLTITPTLRVSAAIYAPNGTVLEQARLPLRQAEALLLKLTHLTSSAATGTATWTRIQEIQKIIRTTPLEKLPAGDDGGPIDRIISYLGLPDTKEVPDTNMTT